MEILTYPDVPTEKWLLDEAIVKFAKQPGVYFAFCNGLCAYVGSSVDIGRRLCQHRTNSVRQIDNDDPVEDFKGVVVDDEVRALVLPEYKIYFAECYFIGVCSPYRNIQGKRTEDAMEYAARTGTYEG